jgi:hypothetical protein
MCHARLAEVLLMRSNRERPPRYWVLPILTGTFIVGLFALPIVPALMTGGVLALVGVVAFGRSSWRSVALLTAALLLGFSAIEAIGTLLVPSAINRTVVKVYEPRSWTIEDPVVGYRPRPGTAVHVDARYGSEPVFQRTYTIEPSGARATAASRNEGPTYLFIGDSFIFGEGLSDTETLASQFAVRLNRPAHVVNLGVPGYAPNHLVRALEAGLYDAHVTGKVSAVFTWISPIQLPRVTGDASWLAGSPRYVIDGSGQLRHTGSFLDHRLQDPLAGLSFLARSRFASLARAAEPALEHERTRLYVAMIARLRNLVRTRYGAPLVLLYDWPDRDIPGENDLQYLPAFRALEALDIPLISVRKVMGPVPRWHEFVIPHDAHPNARLMSELAAEVVGLIDRLQAAR